VQRLHQPATGTAPSLRRNDAHAGHPAVAAPEREVREPHALAVANRHDGRGAVEVARLRERAQGSGVDRERHEVALVRRGEQRRELGVREGRGRLQLDVGHGESLEGREGTGRRPVPSTKRPS
jgi:hypothetical protein